MPEDRPPERARGTSPPSGTAVSAASALTARADLLEVLSRQLAGAVQLTDDAVRGVHGHAADLERMIAQVLPGPTGASTAGAGAAPGLRAAVDDVYVGLYTDLQFQDVLRQALEAVAEVLDLLRDDLRTVAGVVAGPGPEVTGLVPLGVLERRLGHVAVVGEATTGASGAGAAPAAGLELF